VTVFEGKILVFNNASSKEFEAGTSGFVKDFQNPPIDLPSEPGMAQMFPALGGLPGMQDPMGPGQAACLVR
jgi:hypothetical protein